MPLVATFGNFIAQLSGTNEDYQGIIDVLPAENSGFRLLSALLDIPEIEGLEPFWPF